ncbi:magnesium transporter CorA family protein [Candidatus Woesearchaeota archaeon]|nr:magnesium transporter CorA family protein [Candidatus Woesearchaeota archaeon]
MIHGFLYKGRRLYPVDAAAVKNASLGRGGNRLWVIVRNPTAADIALLTERFHIHPTTAEDIASPLTRIKYEEFDNNTVIVFKGIKEAKGVSVKFYTIFLIDGSHYVIAVYRRENDTIEHLAANPKRVESLIRRGEDYILHYIIDKEVDKYVDLRATISEDLRAIEEEFIRRPDKDVLGKLFLKEKLILEIKQRIESITDVCLMLKKPTENFIPNSLIPYFRDVYDHAVKVNIALKTYLDRINGLRNSYLSLTSNRMNDTMRVLTIVMAMMMPMTVITGFYGMNVVLPLQNHPLAYLALLGFIGVTVALMLLIFRSKGWIGKNSNGIQ